MNTQTAPAPAPAKTASKRTKRVLPIIPQCAPAMVLHKPTGVITSWSTLFKRRVDEFEPFFASADEQFIYNTKRRRFDAAQAEKRGDFFAGSNAHDSVFADEDEYAEAGN